MDKLTIELEYNVAAFADRKQALCKVSVNRGDGSLLWTNQYDQTRFSQPLEVIATAASDLASSVSPYGKIL